MIRFALSGILAVCLLVIATVAQAQSSYRVQSGDTLVIEVLEDPSLNRATIVLPDGSFSFPFAGTLRASGQTVPQIEATIRNAIADNFASPPTVFVSVQPLELAEDGDLMEIYVVGEVNLPGLVEMDSGSTVLQAIAVAGGPSRFAAIKRVQLRRIDTRSGAQSVTTINYKALADGATMSRDIFLKDGDVIIVPERRLFE